MKKKGLAAVYEKPNAPFIIREFDIRDVKPDEVLVRITMSTICRSDIHSYQGHRPNPCPGILGHEIIGIVEQLGDEVKTDLRGDQISIGDRITWTEYFHNGESYYRDIKNIPQKSPGVRKYGHDLVEEDPHFNGGFAEYCYIFPGTGILKLPDSISDEEATPLNCGIATMIAVTEAAEIKIGDSVVIQGLGLLGLYGCAIAKSSGAGMIIGLDSVDDRIRMSKKFGAVENINVSNLSEEEIAYRVRELCLPDGPDIVIEVCGDPSVVPLGIQMLRIGGLYVIGGLVNPDSKLTLDGNDILRKLVTIKGIHNYHPRQLIQALDFVKSNQDHFPFGEIVDSKFSLKQIDIAFKKAAERSVLRAAIVP